MKTFLLSLILLLAHQTLYSHWFFIQGQYNSDWQVEATTEIHSPSEVFIIYHFYVPQSYSNVFNSQQITAGPMGLKGANITSGQISFTDNLLKRLYIPLKGSSFFMNKSYNIKTQINLDAFLFATPFPLTNLPQHAAFYTWQKEIPPLMRSQIQDLVKGKTRLADAVLSILTWVKNHTILLVNKKKYSLSTTLRHGASNLASFLDFLAAALRSAGIPARIVHGYSLPTTLTMQGSGNDITCLYPRGDYHWVEFFAPDTGWLPLDPFANFYFFTPQNLIRKTTAFYFKDNLDKLFIYPEKPKNLVYSPNIFSEKGREEKKLQPVAGIPASDYAFSPPLSGQLALERKEVFLSSYLPKTLGLYNNPLKLDMETTEKEILTQRIHLTKPQKISSVSLPLYFLEVTKFGRFWVELTHNGKTYSTQILPTTHDRVNLAYKIYSFRFTEPLVLQGDVEISLKIKNLSAVFWYAVIGNPIGDKNDTWRNQKKNVLHLDLTYQLN